MVNGVQGVFKLIKEENFNMKPLCWRDEGLSTHFPNNRAKYDYGNDSHKGTCMKSIVHLLVLGSLVPGSKIFLHFIYFFLYFFIFSNSKYP